MIGTCSAGRDQSSVSQEPESLPTNRRPRRTTSRVAGWLVAPLLVAGASLAFPQTASPPPQCSDCHDSSGILKQVGASVHDGMECLDCHPVRAQQPHPEDAPDPHRGAICGTCHTDEAATYTSHGAGKVGVNPDLPSCVDCHGGHHVLAPDDRASSVNPANLPDTCGRCHSNLNLVRRYHLNQEAVAVYHSSIHGHLLGGKPAASCIDCHGTDHDAHRILGPAGAQSTVNRLNIPATCGTCHAKQKSAYLEGIHGQLAMRGEDEAPVCIDCHGEHGIIPPTDPDSPVSPTKVAEETCARCHDSAVLNQRYGLPPNRLTTYLDSYHGLKSAAGDTRVANCASCHGAHRILPASNPQSRVNSANLRHTCGTCHPGITQQLASIPIHKANGEGLITPAGKIVESIYKVAIVIIIGSMILHWLIDYRRHLGDLLRSEPQVVRMRTSEVWQHTLLMVSFIVLGVTGFALVYDTSWFAELFFGWKGGFDLRGDIHRVAAVVFIGTAVWHLIFIARGRRGHQFLRDMWPRLSDVVHFWQRIQYNLRRRDERPMEGRFTYVEKAEYWALVWGTAVMVASGLLMWFDEWFSQFLPKGVLDVARAMHFWEAWLATLAILVWHFYSTIFNPEIYPMNPSWLTGKMPEWMHRREHPGCRAGIHEHRGRSSEATIDVSLVLQALRIGPGQTILDAGCGNGYMSKAFAGVLGDTGKVVALDPDETAIATLREETAGTNIQAVVGVISNDTGLPAGSFDLIYLSNVFHGFTTEELAGFLAEVDRLLRPDGTLAVVEFIKKETPVGPPLEFRFSPEELRRKIPLTPGNTLEVGEYHYLQLFAKRSLGT